MGDAADGIEIRRATAEDIPAIVDVATAALGWEPDRPNEELFRWKHLENPAGPSPMWVALADDGSLAGFRAFLRWRFVTPGGSVVDAVRAVDTATHPDFLRRGIFTALTMRAVDELSAEGVGFVFNTPNDQSRPGYLQMGWVEVGRVPVAVRMAGLSAIPTMWRSRQPASRWSEPTTAGEPAPSVLADHDAVARLLPALESRRGRATALGAEHLAWRHALPSLHYRVALMGSRIEDGLLIFRVRRRGPARELVLTNVLVPDEDGREDASLVGALLKETGADYALRAGPSDVAHGFVPLPRGPILTVRDLAMSAPSRPGDWDLALDDVELF